MPNESSASTEEGAATRRRVLRTVLITLGISALFLIALYLLRNFATTLLVVFAGILFGVFLDGACAILMRWLPLPRWAALSFVVLLLLGCCAIFFWLEGPRVADQVRQLSQQLPLSMATLQRQLQQKEWGRALLELIPSSGTGQIRTSSLVGPVSAAFSVTLAILGSLVLIFFLGLYLAASPGFYARGVLVLLTPPHRARGLEVGHALRTALRWWILGRVTTMMIMGFLTTLALWIMQVPLALVLGLLAGVLLFVPYLGAVAAAIPACLIALMESPAKAFWVALMYTGVHVLEGYTVTPYIQKRAVALPPALLLSVQLLSGALFGALGIVFATPLLVVSIVLIQTLYLQNVLGEKVHLLGEHGRAKKRRVRDGRRPPDQT